MNTKLLLSSAALLPLTLTSCGDKTAKAERLPNVIYIMSDDLGIGDLGCYGQKMIKTPGIDSLSRLGMTFANH